jgi:hypothetical protein
MNGAGENVTCQKYQFCEEAEDYYRMFMEAGECRVRREVTPSFGQEKFVRERTKWTCIG